ncbi:MAG: nickel pincer cofactor biosynthesis protein LarC [Acidimicrobiales bacterium]
MTRIAWFNCFSGIAGDMALGSLIAAGAGVPEIVSILDELDLDGWSLGAEPTERGGIGATRALVTVTAAPGPAPWPITRRYADISARIGASHLQARVKARSLSAFAALAEAEATVHRCDPAEVIFHEAGGLDAIVDIVGTAAALEVLGVDEVASSPPALGTGTTGHAHGSGQGTHSRGRLPVPAPAVVELLRGLPAYGATSGAELTTPTGAALLLSLCGSFGPMPAMTIEAVGYGAGERDNDRLPNCVQVVVGAAVTLPGARASSAWPPDADPQASPGLAATLPAGEPVVELATNLDDVSGELLADAIAGLLAAGAHDAWVVPAMMKKGRPGHVLHALSSPVLAPRALAEMERLTGTFGVRGQTLERWPRARRYAEVTVSGHGVRLKVGPHRAKVEHDDAVAASEATGLAVPEVISRAEEAWRGGSGGRGTAGGA